MTKKCGKCRKQLPDEKFAPKPNGTLYSQCIKCREKQGHNPDGSSKPRAYNFDDSLPITPLRDFLAYLTAQNSNLNLEARLPLSDLSPDDDHKTQADSLKDMVNEAMPYRFVYDYFVPTWIMDITNSGIRYYDVYNFTGGDGQTYRYHCAQDSGRQQAARKKVDEAKQRDKIALDTFNCEGRLTITFHNQSPSEIQISLRHNLLHIPYPYIDVPEDVQELVKEGYKQGKTTAKVSILFYFISFQHIPEYCSLSCMTRFWRCIPNPTSHGRLSTTCGTG